MGHKIAAALLTGSIVMGILVCMTAILIGQRHFSLVALL